ncbi:TPA: hypothetical protein KDY51_003814 [Vibrio parahaemolyticus]|uniref:Uncharacterized protein n=1 Tax=Vibrio diabolicus TaxID=50719 RepID=A0AA92LRM3_9VIBR|nr:MULTISPECIES: hypothetical protein [Vibrio harveyi group]MCG6238950.1 hypothetical protein [Vibrio diabolicus]MCR9817837.1 hypothetical protein [Vibrio parahaemolyticus]QRG83352.1 hypothetical protein JOS67_03295 [Vibrio diabolicus]HBC3449924.1 hypothetical protein [Vibrio parahaemolyticus]
MMRSLLLASSLTIISFNSMASKVDTAANMLADMTSCVIKYEDAGQRHKANAMQKTLQLTLDRAVSKYGSEVSQKYQEKVGIASPSMSRCDSLYDATN